MAKKEVHIQSLQDFLPQGAFEPVYTYLHNYNVHLTVARKRKSVLGDYRHRTTTFPHRISVNGNLNRYSFLVNLLHELAHLLTFEEHGAAVLAHGREWKVIYGKLMAEFIAYKLFPPDLEKELKKSLKNPAASTCAEDVLLRVLKKYDEQQTHLVFVEEIPLNGLFQISGNRIFRKGTTLRKRIQCMELSTGHKYLFSPVFEVEKISTQ